VQRFALVMVVETMAGQPAVGRKTAGVSMVLVPASYMLWVTREINVLLCAPE